MAQTTLVKQGCFDADVENKINAMFTELYAGLNNNKAATASYIRTDAGTKTLLAAVTVDRTVTIVVNITTVFADGDGAQPTLAIGQTGTTTKFAATSAFASAAAGTTLSFGGTLSANKALILTQVAATGTTSTGAYTVTATAIQ